MNVATLTHNISHRAYKRDEDPSITMEHLQQPYSSANPDLFKVVKDNTGTIIHQGDKTFRTFQNCHKFNLNGTTYQLHKQRIWDMAYTGSILFLTSAGKVYAVNHDTGKVIVRFPNFINPKELRYNDDTKTLYVRDRSRTITMHFSGDKLDSYTSDETYSNRWMHRLRRTIFLFWDIIKRIPSELKLGVEAVLSTRTLVVLSGLVSLTAGLGGASLGSLVAEAYGSTGFLYITSLVSGFAIGSILMAGFLFMSLTATAVALATEHTFLQY